MSTSISNKHLKNLQRQKKQDKKLAWKANRKERAIYARQQKELLPAIQKKNAEWLINFPDEYNNAQTYYLSLDEPLNYYKPDKSDQQANINRACQFDNNKHPSEILVTSFICLDVDIHDYENNSFGCDGYHAAMCEDCYKVYCNRVDELEIRPDTLNSRIICLVNKDHKFVMRI